MKKNKGLLVSCLTLCVVVSQLGNRADAAPIYTGETHSPTGNRALCSSGSQVDFSAYPSDIILDMSTGRMSYNINIKWKRCLNTDTRAYAIFAASEICPLSGWYSGVGDGTSHDCIKYIGNPAYTGPGNQLRCPGSRKNDQCVNSSFFTGVRKEENQPAWTEETKVIPMSVMHSSWSLVKNTPGSWSIPTNNMCQYFKVGPPSFDTENTDRCIEINISVSWGNTTVKPTISCGNLYTTPQTPEPGQTFSITASFTTSGGLNGDDLNTNYSLRIAIPTAGFDVPGRYATAFGEIAWEGGSKTGSLPSIFGVEAGQPISIASTGVHPVTYEIDVNGASNTPLTCSGSVTIANKPYFKVYGGDVSDGMSFGETCTNDSDARIIGFGRKDGVVYSGSSAQFAVFAINAITDFASGNIRDSENTANLTFSNETGSYGGNFASANAVCAPDFWESSGGITVSSSINLNPSGNGTLRRNGNLNLNFSGASGLNNGSRTTIYVNGDVMIHNNITYNQTGGNGSYAEVSDIPSFRLIVKGNIYIHPDVTELNGQFVAIPKDGVSSSGRFYSCGFPDGSGFSSPNATNITYCHNNLTVYGSVVADLLKLNRTGGTLLDASSNESWNSGGNPAEKFIYTPELWLTGGSGNNRGTDAYRTMPPAL